MTHTELIERAAAWLDVRHPGWFEQIDVTELNMMDSSKCIAGQLGCYWVVFSRDMAEDHGTSSKGEFAAFEFKPYWVSEIESRLAATRERRLPEPALAK